MQSKVREHTIHWLVENQNKGAFEGFTEENINFDILPDSEIEWYFINWYFTDEFISMELENERLKSNYKEHFNERNRILLNGEI